MTARQGVYAHQRATHALPKYHMVANTAESGCSATRLGQRAACVIVSVVILLACSAVFIDSLNVSDDPHVTHWVTIRVSAYDTLWDIAESHPVSDLSTSGTVALIQEKNALPSATIYEGQTILAPADSGEGDIRVAAK